MILRVQPLSTSTLVIIIFLMFGCGTSTITTSPAETISPRSDIEIFSSSEFVVIDRSETAFTIFTGIPKNIEKADFEGVKQKVSSQETLIMLTWEQFLESVNEYARAVILVNDYPNVRIVDGLVCLIASRQGSGAPWGLTWNGGIALTFNDYEHAQRTYESYKESPTSYRPIRDPRGDPVHPSGKLPFGGCY